MDHGHITGQRQMTKRPGAGAGAARPVTAGGTGDTRVKRLRFLIYALAL